MNKSKQKDTGMKLEVNDKILDSCTALMKAIKILIMKAKELQKEIVAQGRVSLFFELNYQFYFRHEKKSITFFFRELRR